MGWALALHGGAGDIPRTMSLERKEAAEACLRECLSLGGASLESSASALDVVELVVNMLENDPVFNAGRGSVLTNEGTVEMEALIVDGSTGNCGAVSGLKTVVNPISLARLVMEKTPHIYLAFEGAEQFAKEQGVKTADPSYFFTEENRQRLERAKNSTSVMLDHTASDNHIHLDNCDSSSNGSLPLTSNGDAGETVGCVAVDKHGNCAAATSTGGLVNKMVGRIGDTPLVGCGTYANHFCAISATGKGEAIIKATLARDVAALMEYKGLSLAEAMDEVIMRGRFGEGNGGAVAVSNAGDIAMAFNSTGMFRASINSFGNSEVSIWH